MLNTEVASALDPDECELDEEEHEQGYTGNYEACQSNCTIVPIGSIVSHIEHHGNNEADQVYGHYLLKEAQ